jgi:hypothetical protein
MVAVNLGETRKTADTLGQNSGSNRPDEGKALLSVTKMEVEKDSITVKFEVLQHEVEGNSGRTFQDFLSLDGKFVDKTLDLAFATGVLDKDYFAQQQATGMDCDIEFEKMVDRTFVTTIGHFTNKKNRTYAQLGWDILATDAPEAKGYPGAGENLDSEPDTPAEPKKAGGAPF